MALVQRWPLQLELLCYPVQSEEEQGRAAKAATGEEGRLHRSELLQAST